jgi:hypothetical protein
MRAIEFDAFGDPSVLQLVKAPNPRIDEKSDKTTPASGPIELSAFCPTEPVVSWSSTGRAQ